MTTKTPRTVKVQTYRRLFGRSRMVWFSCQHGALFNKPIPVTQDVVFCTLCGDYREVTAGGKRVER